MSVWHKWSYTIHNVSIKTKVVSKVWMAYVASYNL